MKLFCGIFLILLLAESRKAVADDSLCSDLVGTWRNQLNSNMTIETISESGTTFSGVYHTAVESKEGAARLASKVSGMIHPVENGKLIGFNVLWNKGASLTAWVGQCIVCDGKEKLYTTWVLRSYLPLRKRWMTTLINQDTFYRVDATDNADNQVITSSVSESSVSSAGLQGKWTSPDGDSIDLSDIQEGGTWLGSHQSEGGNEAIAIGQFDGNQTYTAVGLVATSSNKIRGWTGHIDKSQSSPKVMETSWLEHTFSDNCNNPRKRVNFGMDNYSKVVNPS